MTRRRHVLRVVPVIALGAGCAATRYDGAVDTTAVAVTTTTQPIVGSTEERVEQLAAAAESLSNAMIADGDEDAVGERVEALWESVRDDVAANRPDLIEDFESSVEMCARAVRFSRAADADKAARNLRALADAYLIG